jgi:hypothetical protein
MNKTTTPPGSQLLTVGAIGLTKCGSEVEDRPITAQKIITAFEKLNHLHFYSGEAVAQFAAIGAIRQIIFRPGSSIIIAYESDAREARKAVELLQIPRATALIDEIVNLTKRMIQFEAALPPVRPYVSNLKTAELNLAGIALYLGSGTLWNYLGKTAPLPELHVKNPYALSQPELMEWCKWNEGTNNDDLGVVVEKVKEYLATLCR